MRDYFKPDDLKKGGRKKAVDEGAIRLMESTRQHIDDRYVECMLGLWSGRLDEMPSPTLTLLRDYWRFTEDTRPRLF